MHPSYGNAPSYVPKRMAPAPQGTGACPPLMSDLEPRALEVGPASPHPRVARLPEKISPQLPPSILGSSHSNERCWLADRRFRIKVR